MGSDHPCEGSPERVVSYRLFLLLCWLTCRWTPATRIDLAYMADAPKRRGKGNRREGMLTRECEKPCGKE